MHDEWEQQSFGTVELTFLGTGTSNGIPIIGCSCPVCTSDDPRDRRSRTSAVVRFHGYHVLIDTATELRLQALAVGLRRVDAVLFTHAHADHVGGFDDLRRFNELAQRHLPVYAHVDTAATLRERFAYAFVDQFPFYGGKPDLTLHEFTGGFSLFGHRIQPIPVWHGRWLVHGFRFGPLVYVTDAKTIPPASLEMMRGADILVINALRHRPHPTHLSIDEALAVIEEVAPRRAYLVHMTHDVSHAATSALLPPHVELAYDGLTVRTGDE
ncbi:MBL fold metallo-hydrolase [Sphaerobacter thermophilus]|jgi:phosphoribosyl 1,2-cyclic phosphate phosphodiesterase|uniref:MBL fold metallo-hydrolase n=1 Tax=Sphaerobacter thermophilus TaxID=2057 RepID=UPI0039C04B3E